MRIVVFSATSVIAEECIKVWAEQGPNEFVLVGRNLVRLDSQAADLRLRFSESSFQIEVINFESAGEIQSLVAKLALETIDLALIAQGSSTDQQLAQTDLVYLAAEIQLNAVSVVVAAEALASVLAAANHGTLGVIGSVAGDRGRAYNYSYGASKAMIATFVEGLQQRFAKTKVSVGLIKPGPTRTPMTSDHQGRFAEPSKVAKTIVLGLQRKRRVIYAPKIWKIIMFVVRLIPFAVFKRMKF